MLYKLFGCLKISRNSPGLMPADLPEFPIKFWSIQLAVA